MYITYCNFSDEITVLGTISLVETLNKLGARIYGPISDVCVTSVLDPHFYPLGVFPYSNWLMLVVDRSCFSSNCLGLTGIF
jgi:hypothetical protein